MVILFSLISGLGALLFSVDLSNAWNGILLDRWRWRKHFVNRNNKLWRLLIFATMFLAAGSMVLKLAREDQTHAETEQTKVLGNKMDQGYNEVNKRLDAIYGEDKRRELNEKYPLGWIGFGIENGVAKSIVDQEKLEPIWHQVKLTITHDSTHRILKVSNLQVESSVKPFDFEFKTTTEPRVGETPGFTFSRNIQDTATGAIKSTTFHFELFDIKDGKEHWILGISEKIARQVPIHVAVRSRLIQTSPYLVITKGQIYCFETVEAAESYLQFLKSTSPTLLHFLPGVWHQDSLINNIDRFKGEYFSVGTPYLRKSKGEKWTVPDS